MPRISSRGRARKRRHRLPTLGTVITNPQVGTVGNSRRKSTSENGPGRRANEDGSDDVRPVARLRAVGHRIKDEDVARLSPLKARHIDFLGRYRFNITASGPGQGLRPFRDPDTPEDGDEEE